MPPTIHTTKHLPLFFPDPDGPGYIESAHGQANREFHPVLEEELVAKKALK
jgi:hypothetical protein